MGFLTRLLAGLVAASTLGTGLAGTANAVDTNGAAGTTKSVVKLTADDTNNLPDHIVNGSFDYPSVPSWTGLAGSSSNKFNKGKRFATINPGTGKYGSGCAMSTTGRAIPNWNRSSFAWSSTQGDTHYSGGMSCEAGNVELNYDSVHHNQFAELTADQQGTAIYQDVKVTPGTMMKWSLKHSSATSAYVDKMQVMIGEPYKETAQEATRIASENGNKVGEKMTTISTPTTSDRADNKKWDTYSGTYLVPDGVTTVRFTFKSVASAEWYSGNDLDDIEFSRSYKLTYDKNSSDAAGEVPSNQRGKENTTQPAASKTNGTVKTVADDTSNLPDHLVNGDFEYPGANVLSKNRYDEKDYNWWGVSRKDKMVYDPSHETQWVSLPSTFDSDRFAWDSTEVARVQNRSSQWHTNEVELQRDSRTGNMYAELCAYQAHTSIRQYIHTTPGTLYKVRLKHASLSRDYLDKMQVLVGPAGNEQPVRMTRVESQNGLDATGESTASTTVSTHASNGMEIKDGQGTPYSSRNHNGQWATYEGVYVATSDVTSFTFKSVDAKAYNLGNLLDDIVFDKAYRLSYDKNSTAASGQVPSNERGRENTVQPAKAKTTGTVKTVADENVRYGSLANGDFSYPSFSDIQKNEQGGDADLRTFLKSDDGTLWYNMSATDLSKYGKIGQIPGFDSSRFAWSSTENGSRVELQQDRNTKNTYAEIVAQQDNTSICQNVSTGNGGVLYKIRLKHASRQSSHADRMQVLVGSDTDHATPVEMTRVTSNGHGDKVGGKSTTITTKVSNTDPRDHGAQWETYEGYYQVPEGQKNTVFMFKSLEGFKEVETLPGNNVGNLVDDIEFSRSYKLTYDANSSDASGQVPSDTAANTTRPAKSETDGKVSDLVQRTTTHEDGSVTVRTIDTSTDVVSGCQVYYPAGQKITLATMAKDDDCWDSSMLSRPGYTQLGWNQDRNATQAQAQVTMVEGGMTVYAVWVGNPVLTYDTNKPSTWSGQMPSTPASVSVPYNTAAADGSGWRAGDTTKIRGYRFLGWYTGPQDNAGLYDWTRPLTGNVTVYAHWQRLQANVIYNANGGTGSHANTTGWQYSDVTIPGDTSKSFKRDKYVFKGWGTKPGKADVVYKDGSKVALQDKDITLYAQWQEVHENFVETGGIGLPIAIAGGVLLLMFGIGSTVMLTRRMNGHGMPDDE